VTSPTSPPSRPAPSAENPPSYPGWWQLLTAVNSTGPRWPGALRAALAVVLPASVVLALGHETEMLLIASGGFTVIYGEGLPFRTRWRVMGYAALFLAVGQMAGAFVGSVVWPQIDGGGTRWWMLLIALYTTLIAVVAGFVQNALRLPPPGGFFIVMASGGATMVAKQGMNPVEVGVWAAVGGASAVLIGMVPALWGLHRPETAAVANLERVVADYTANPSPTFAKTHQAEMALTGAWFTLADAGIVRGGEPAGTVQDGLAHRALAAQLALATHNRRVAGRADRSEAEEVADTPSYVDLDRLTIPLARPSIRYRIYRSLTLYSHATMTAVKILVACVLSGVVGIALGFDRPDWAVVSAMLVLQWGPDRKPGTIRGLHRLIGSVFGIGLFAVFHSLGLHSWGLLAALAFCQFFAEVFVVKNYAFTVIVTTPLALMMGGSMHLPLGEVVFSRTMEVVIAVIFAIGGLWLFFLRDAEIRHSRRLVDRSFGAMGTLLGRLLTSRTPADALAERRDLQYELLSERRAAQSTAYSAPRYAQAHWPHHLEIQHAGYALLDFCTTAGHRAVSVDEIGQLAATVRAARAAGQSPE
jgi:hypothetical protein